MCELTKEAYEADTHQPLSPSEIAAIPVRRTWYGVVGTHQDFLVPQDLTADHKVAQARAIVKNADSAVLGPWHVVTLTENLRTPQ